MLQVSELLNVPFFQNFTLVAGAEGLNRQIRNTTILEYETYTNGFQVFLAGDFIMTSLFFAKDHPELIRSSFAELDAREAAGIAVKTSFYTELPQDALDYADEHHLPVFMFADTSMEDIIVTISDIIKRKEAFFNDERELLRFMQPHSDSDILHFASQLIPFAYGKYQIAYLTPVSSSLNIDTVFGKMSYQNARPSGAFRLNLAKYKNGIVCIYNFSEEQHTPIDMMIENRLRDAGLRMKDFYAGMSHVHSDFIRFDSAMEQAFAANQIAVFTQSPRMDYGEIGIYQYLLPLLRSKPLMEEYNRTIRILTEYDEKYRSELLQTALVYVKNHGKINDASKELFQHPNTVRYRLGKIKELLKTDDFYEHLYLVIKLYELQ